MRTLERDSDRNMHLETKSNTNEGGVGTRFVLSSDGYCDMHISQGGLLTLYRGPGTQALNISSHLIFGNTISFFQYFHESVVLVNI